MWYQIVAQICVLVDTRSSILASIGNISKTAIRATLITTQKKKTQRDVRKLVPDLISLFPFSGHCSESTPRRASVCHQEHDQKPGRWLRSHTLFSSIIALKPHPSHWPSPPETGRGQFLQLYLWLRAAWHSPQLMKLSTLIHHTLTLQWLLILFQEFLTEFQGLG